MPSNVNSTIVNRLIGGPSDLGYVDIADSSNFIQLTKDGTNPSAIIFGTWESTAIGPQYGGTGVANSSTSTITLGGPLTLSGAFPFVGTLTGATNVTFPTSGTLLTDAIFPLSISNGGTGQTLTIPGGIVYCGLTSFGISLPTATSGQVLVSSALPILSPGWTSRLLDDANANVFLGLTAGNRALTGNNNVGIGHGSLDALTTGTFNCSLGTNSLSAETNGAMNCAFGYGALLVQNFGFNNCAFGYEAGNAIIGGAGYSIFGTDALNLETVGDNNSVFGFGALFNKSFSINVEFTQ